MKCLVTGWAGFIGSNLVRYLLQKTEWTIYGMDSMTYASRPMWAFQMAQSKEKYKERFRPEMTFCDIRSLEHCQKAVNLVKPDVVIHLAVESHVCRSIEHPGKFFQTNTLGTANLLEAVRIYAPKAIFHHVSTDEVFGVAQDGEFFNEQSRYDPKSPYAASKASADHIVRAYHHTYGLNTRSTHCSNNYGENQHEEKLIPKAIKNIIKRNPVTIYGKGDQIRDWIDVRDHCRGIHRAIAFGSPGSTHLLGGDLQMSNSKVIELVFKAVQETLEEDKAESTSVRLETVYTNDRPTDDQRYAIDCSKAKSELGWYPNPESFFMRLKDVVRWYRKHEP